MKEAEGKSDKETACMLAEALDREAAELELHAGAVQLETPADALVSGELLDALMKKIEESEKNKCCHGLESS